MASCSQKTAKIIYFGQNLCARLKESLEPAVRISLMLSPLRLIDAEVTQCVETLEECRGVEELRCERFDGVME